MKKTILSICIFLLTQSFGLVYAVERNQSRLNFGFSAGANMNQITGLPMMIESNPLGEFSGYTFDTHFRAGFLGGVFLNYRAHHLFAVQPEIGFAMHHGKVSYSDINAFEYNVIFRYNYLTAGVGFKFYPWQDLFLSVTPQVGFNLRPDNLFYTSNGEAMFGPDLETQQLMRNIITGRTNVVLGFGVGYQFWNRFYVSFRYNLGLSDMIETSANTFGFTERANLSSSFQLTVGFVIPLR